MGETGVSATRAVVARAAIERLCAEDHPPLELLAKVARRVRAAVPYAAAGWLLTDPATLLHTGALSEGVPAALLSSLIDNELTAADVTKFAAVARLPRPAVALSDATAGELARSARQRTLYAPAGFGDELRVAFRTGGACWGVACLARTVEQPWFDVEEVAFMAGISAHVGHGLRNALLVEACRNSGGGPEAPGIVVLGERGTVEAITGEAERWLDELPGAALELPLVVHEVARRAHALGGPSARARVALKSGRWLTVQGARLRAAPGSPARVAVMLEPVRRAELAPMIVECYELTEREREVTRLLVSGLTTTEIASALGISSHTLRDHVKAVFAKFGVRSRPELTARLFHEPF
jgi:DNA-binding CsgD family transcriptional regulator